MKKIIIFVITLSLTINIIFLPLVSGDICDNLLALYHLDGNALDSVGDNHGTINGASLISSMSSEFNQAYSFDGNNDDIRTSLDFSGLSDFTVSLWAYTNPGEQRDYRAIWSNDGTSYSCQGDAILFSSSTEIRFKIADDNDDLAVGDITGRWVHIVSTDGPGGAGRNIYINGIGIGPTSAGATTTGNVGFHIGGYNECWFWTDPDYFEGMIDEVAVWDRALSAQEVNDLYHSGEPIACGLTDTGIIIDNLDAGTSQSGSWTDSSYYSGYYATSYHHSPELAGEWFEWTTPLTSGVYEVNAWWVEDSGRPSDSVYRITHHQGEDDIIADQTTGGLNWNNLGTYYFSNSGTVRLISGSPSTQGAIADAVKFTQISNCCPADNSAPYGVISIQELISYIQEWKAGNVSIQELITAITEWKSGC